MSADGHPLFLASGRRIGLGFVHAVTAADGRRDLRELCLLWRSRGYPPSLVPFASSGGQAHLALDFGASPSNPSVVYVYPDGEAEATGYWSTSCVAADVEAFLEMLGPRNGTERSS